MKIDNNFTLIMLANLILSIGVAIKGSLGGGLITFGIIFLLIMTIKYVNERDD